MTERYVKGEKVKPANQASPSAPKGRTCAFPDCGTRLSIYNSSKFCWRHAPLDLHVPSGRRWRESA